LVPVYSRSYVRFADNIFRRVASQDPVLLLSNLYQNIGLSVIQMCCIAPGPFISAIVIVSCPMISNKPIYLPPPYLNLSQTVQHLPRFFFHCLILDLPFRLFLKNKTMNNRPFLFFFLVYNTLYRQTYCIKSY